MHSCTLTISVGIPLAPEDTVLFSDVSATQNDVLSSFCVRLAHPVVKTKGSHFERVNVSLQTVVAVSHLGDKALYPEDTGLNL